MTTSKTLRFAAPVAVFALALALAAPAFAAQVVIINADPAGTGLNDPAPRAPVAGNDGVTLGEQRVNVLLRAAKIWAGELVSDVPITIRAITASQTCTPTSAVLASAGANVIESDFVGAPLAGTWYSGALANSLAGVDLSPLDHDINTQFNLNLDADPMCLGGFGWYYGYDHNEGSQVDLLATLLHEFGHGLGFQNFCNESTGTLTLDVPDTYTTFTRDLETDMDWNDMSNAQRVASAINDPDVVWTGPSITAIVPDTMLGAAQLVINSPPAIAGTFTAQAAAFGPLITSAPGITGDVVQGIDPGGVSTTDGCEALSNGAAISGNIALVDRGNCNFTVKVKNAQDVGAVAVLIANNAGGLPPMGGSDPTVTIPSYGITMAEGAAIVGQLPGVNATMTVDPSNLAGVREGFLRVNAPNPLQPGSSISHWTPEALPNLLMEPAITAALTDDVDLTLQLFEDIGWDLSRLFVDGFETGNTSGWSAVVP